ncbi:Glutamate--tRNA ligase [Koleobacter methoxysyntrophicus]|uniref:Glutamate--tRNA ligase n=1 Tax=Koleobacter methoxysyntrophicus TaxID=2751313 RepID=A0A8A0RL22_9FIRM|nr:glutamate--tRNA ligase [Koleobacter methoxysyntrophicus]QSQ08943.1 Glutamate--tRNA ligase [Koleobacter methoxysyntrophicus]
MVRVRFAPSPTGHLHIGGARTALFNLLFARRHGGTFILRIEDTDLKRSSYESEEVIIKDLQWLGIDWDEGVVKGGEFGPYRSTERRHIYKEYVDKLLKEGKAYYCYCTPEELEEERKNLLKKGQMPRYMGKCRYLSPEEIKAFEEQGRKPVIRFKVPDDQLIVVDDMVRGKVEFDSSGIGDFVIVKSDGIPVYNFAVVIDDYLMKITHVIRGEEHLSNTPRQILIYDALGMEIPKFAHVSLILGKDRTKMSKRHGATWVEQYRDEGYLPEAIINFLALLGWSPESEQEIFSMEELCRQFSLDRVAKNPAVFDIDKLKWMNGHYIRNSSTERITEMAVPYLLKAGYIKERDAEERFSWLNDIVDAVKESLTVVSEVAEKTRLFFEDSVSPEDDEAREVLKQDHIPHLIEVFREKVKQAPEVDEGFLNRVFKEIQKQTGIKGRKLFMPVRVLLTGQTHGPELGRILMILGKNSILKRLDHMQKNFI